VLRQELSQAQEEMEKKGSKLEKKDCELQATSQGLKAVNWLVKGGKDELDSKRIAFQGEKDGLLRALE